MSTTTDSVRCARSDRSDLSSTYRHSGPSGPQSPPRSHRWRAALGAAAALTLTTTLTGLPAQAASNYPGTIDPYDGYIQDVDVVESVLRTTARQMTVDVDLCFESGATTSPSTTGIDGAPLLQLGPEVVPVASGWRTIRPGVQRADTTVTASTGERYTVRYEVFRSTGDGVQAQSTVKVLPQASPNRGGCGVLRMPVSMPTSQIKGNVLDTWATDQFGTTHEDTVRISASAPTPSVPTTVTLTLNRPWVALRGNTLCPTRFGDNLHPSTFYPFIQWLGCERISSGYTDGTYRYSRAISRQEVAIMLYRTAQNSPDVASWAPPSHSPFSDVRPSSTVAYAAITWLHDQGVSGYTDGTFRPQRQVSRGESARLLFLTNGQDGVYQPPTTSQFPDVSTRAAIFPAVSWLVESQATSGYQDGTFKPTRSVSRGEIAKFLFETTY